jgi:predicted ATPase/DNA-binding SARP family transcriptional activator
MYPIEEDRETKPALQLRVLGEFLLLVGGTPVALPNSGRLQALLAYLLLHRTAPQPRAHLAFLLWPDSPEAQALTNLRKLLHQVGQAVPALEACLLSSRQHLQWRPDAPCASDLVEFEAALACAAIAPDMVIQRTALEAAVTAYRGDLLPGCYDEWILPERERLRQSFTQSLDHLIGLLESARDYPAAIRSAERLLQEDPLREATYRRLMALHRDNGDPAGALRIYQACAAMLQQELGMDPGPATQALYDELLRAATPPPTGERPRLHNLPTPPNRFIGRRAEVAGATTLLRQSGTRLVSFVGPGGSGKTRLALEVAGGLLGDFPDGVWFVDLAPLRDAALVVPAIVRSLQLPDLPGQPLLIRLQDYLRDRHMLLLLDNFEQVAAAAPQVAQLLAAAEQLKVLVTSRAALHIYAEQEFPVPPLALPDVGNLPPLDELATQEAVALFLERARAVQPGLAAPPATLRTVAEICRRVDGLPLAIELAAARTRLLTPDALLSRLERRLPLLTGGPHDLPDRQQTLRRTIAWSYQLLDPAGQRLFSQLAVFVGGWTVEAAEAVCSAETDGIVLTGLEDLAAQNLVYRQTTPTGEPRFIMLETIREFAGEQLTESGATEAVSRQHAEFFLALAVAAPHRLRSAEREMWLAQLDAEQENRRTALVWSQAQPDGGETMLRLAAALFWFWFFRGYWSEGRDRLKAALAKSDAPIPARAACLWGAGVLALYESDEKVARAHLDAGVALAREIADRENLGYALINLPRMLMADHSRVSIARACGEEGLAMLRELGDPRALAFGLQQLGISEAFGATGVLSYSSAKRHIEESMRIFEEIGDRWGLAQSLNGLAVVALWRHDSRTARQLIEEAIVQAREQDDKLGMIMALVGLGNIARSEGNYAEARRALDSALVLSRKLGIKGLIPSTLHTLGHLSLIEGDYQLARELCEESLRLSQDLGDTVDTGWALRNLALLAHHEQDDAQAIALCRECLTIFGAIDQPLGIAFTLVGVMQYMGTNWPPETAAQLLSVAATRSQEVPDAHMDQFDRRIFDELIAATRGRLGDAGFARAWAAGQALSRDEAITYALVAVAEMQATQASLIVANDDVPEENLPLLAGNPRPRRQVGIEA